MFVLLTLAKDEPVDSMDTLLCGLVGQKVEIMFNDGRRHLSEYDSVQRDEATGEDVLVCLQGGEDEGEERFFLAAIQGLLFV